LCYHWLCHCRLPCPCRRRRWLHC
jgi:hypothetical protein